MLPSTFNLLGTNVFIGEKNVVKLFFSGQQIIALVGLATGIVLSTKKNIVYNVLGISSFCFRGLTILIAENDNNCTCPKE